MGVTWRAMPLLSTLAALVIIAHSEENRGMSRELDRKYNFDLRPRVFDTGTPGYDEPWTSAEEGPVMQQKSAQRELWDDSSERPLRRLRPTRKRKRRPISSFEEEVGPRNEEHREYDALDLDTPYNLRPLPTIAEEPIEDQRYSREHEQSGYRHSDVYPEQTTPLPKRRRKKPGNRTNRWGDDFLDIERPARRRTLRRKRPAVENFPRKSEDQNYQKHAEFDDLRVDEMPRRPNSDAESERVDEVTRGPNSNAESERTDDMPRKTNSYAESERIDDIPRKLNSYAESERINDMPRRPNSNSESERVNEMPRRQNYNAESEKVNEMPGRPNFNTESERVNEMPRRPNSNAESEKIDEVPRRPNSNAESKIFNYDTAEVNSHSEEANSGPVTKNLHKEHDKSLSEFSREVINPQETNQGIVSISMDMEKGLEKSGRLDEEPYIIQKLKDKITFKGNTELIRRLDSESLREQYNILTTPFRKAFEKTIPVHQLDKNTGNNSNNSTVKCRHLKVCLLRRIKNEKMKKVSLSFFDFRQALDQIIEDMNAGAYLANRPIDPKTLKEILKRSNGASLSEILQQNNLSLSDLLQRKEDAVKLTKDELKKENKENLLLEQRGNLKKETIEQEKIYQEQKEVVSVPEVVPEQLESLHLPNENSNEAKNEEKQTLKSQLKLQNEQIDNSPKIADKPRRQNIRRKLRMKTPINVAHKSQLNRDLIAETARKYHNSRNLTKSKEWKHIVPMMNVPKPSDENSNKNEDIEIPSTTISVPEETTIINETDYQNPSALEISIQTEISDREQGLDDVNKASSTTISTTQDVATEETTYWTVQTTTTTEKPTTTKKVPRLRPSSNRMGLRRQAFNNRLKRKRIKQKISTTELPVEQDNVGSDVFAMPNMVSSSEFIARTQTPKPSNVDNNEEDFTTLDDYMTTEKSRHTESAPRFTRNSTISMNEIEQQTTTKRAIFVSTTEETAKFEIEEILNDTRTSARLSRILKERNMTLDELFEHRERGSSHVHLADIFHNASKEPNPPEPFLSKSSIEPISKETYPLRAILEANLHDSTAKATTIVPVQSQSYFGNIPVVMDFGNNVNENGENMGIMSLFDKFATTDISGIENTEIGKDSEGTPYVTTVIKINNTDSNETTSRESRVFDNDDNNLNNDIVAWSALFELMKKNQINDSTDELLDVSKEHQSSHEILLGDVDGDGLIVLEDLQRLKDADSLSNLDANSYEADIPVPGILDKAPSHTRSVTVATASIIGLTMILFLLTYAVFKWKQQRNLLRQKQNFGDDRIPTPVFENIKKGHNNNPSSRSVSPMLATSNIYTLSTLDSNGKDSPDYMWDSLRKPFQ